MEFSSYICLFILSFRSYVAALKNLNRRDQLENICI
jgi:hypothetical protein